MTNEKVDFISYVALKVATEARSATEIFDILLSYEILKEEEIVTCLVGALVINGFKLDVALDQLESIKGVNLAHGDSMLLN